MATLADKWKEIFDALKDADPPAEVQDIADGFAEAIQEADEISFQNTKLGFFSEAAVAQPTVSGADTDEKVTSIIAALVALGLVTE